ncbi:Phosphotransferase enzyme family protein [Mycolicibacterium rutilum]|uniref:Phosphotransferase enzyme family protein n=1 Tax=Mycolicibacterium rutilum TaxID=370526 RepID=A0A1H6J6Z4_MYCRU|nr:phosphotransferase [Mycolicibacterium rutilum]SEH57760.1 Phosphotransferase enzyme family protein [Mycolicibacterium rutilum]
MQTRSGAEIVVDNDVVHKLHRPGINPHDLTVRLGIAARSDCLLSPLSAPERVGDRWRTRWPLVKVVAQQPESLPWAQAGQLLARLHREPRPPRAPAHGWPQRMRRAVDALRGGHPDVRRAAATLPDPVWRPGSPDRPMTLVHGDWHLGQLGRRDDGPWLLIDVDDLGVGDPAWDLARPAGFWAAGLIPDGDWHRFLDAYRGADGPALPDGDPWPVLEPFARAAVVQAAAHHPDDELLLAACVRMG